MSVKVASNRFIVPSIRAGFYQQLLRSVSDFQKLGDRLVREAETAYWFRQSNIVEEVGLMLSNIPVKEYQLIGQYYLGWCAYRKGEDAQGIFENIIENSKTFKVKGLMSLAASKVAKNDYDAALKLCQEVTKRADNPPLLLTAARSIAFLKSMHGDHKQALLDLEKLAPLARYTNPIAYYNYLNSFAVELTEVGRIEEAQNVCRITLASPFINAYPEWRETWQDLALRGYKSRSVVSVPKLPLDSKNVVPLPVVERSPGPPQKGRAKVLDLQAWKEKMVKEPNGENGDEINIDEMSDKDILFEIMNLTSEDDITREQLQQILDAVRKITSKKP